MKDEHEIKSTFAKNLNNLIRDSGISRAEVAKTLGVSTSAVGAWCTGAKSPLMDKVDKLAALFNVSRSALLDEKTSSPAPKRSTREWLEDLLAEKGVIKQGKELTGVQTELLVAQNQMIDAWLRLMGGKHE